MSYDGPKRKPLRKSGYDYKQNDWYYVTVCAQQHGNIFGNIENGKSILNTFGVIVKEQWHWLEEQYPYIKVDEHVIMPDHFHGILVITNRSSSVGNGRDRSLRNESNQSIKSLSGIMGAFKTTASKQIHLKGYTGFRWQKSFYDRIIRNETDYLRIKKYIHHNPSHWQHDMV